MEVPVKLTWAIDGLRHQVEQLYQSTDGVSREDRLKYAMRAIEDIERWALYMEGQPMPPRRDGVNVAFMITFANGQKYKLFGKKNIRNFLEGRGRHAKYGQSIDRITGIKQTEYSWQHASLDEMYQEAYNHTDEEE